MLGEREFIVRTWLENDDLFSASVRDAARHLIESDRHSESRFERVRESWSDLCDWAGPDDPALASYTCSITSAVKDAGLRPAADTPPRDFIFNAWTHEYAWFLASPWWWPNGKLRRELESIPGIPREETAGQSSPSTFLTLRVFLTAWNPQAAIDNASQQITDAYKELLASQWSEWKATKPANLTRQVECLFLRTNMRMTVDQIAEAIERDGWSDASRKRDIRKIRDMEPGSLQRVINRNVSTLAKRHGLSSTRD